jgi:hypothetical protein
VAELVREMTVDTAWVAALERLHALHGKCFDLVVDIAKPDQGIVRGQLLNRLDASLRAHAWQSVETVANTIFPSALAATASDRDVLYRRYQRLLPVLHRIRANNKGTYFERLIAYPLQPEATRANQLDLLVHDLQTQLRSSRRAHAYELQIFAPGKDRLPRGFPCLSSLSVHLDGDALRLAATYRNQFYIQKALGNFLGLSRLQAWVAREVGLRVGAMSVHAFHAEIDPGFPRREVGALLEDLRA